MGIARSQLLMMAAKPDCSRCLRTVSMVVYFLASKKRADGTRNTNSGVARTVRLCRQCCRKLLAEFPKARHQGKREAR